MYLLQRSGFSQPHTRLSSSTRKWVVIWPCHHILVLTRRAELVSLLLESTNSCQCGPSPCSVPSSSVKDWVGARIISDHLVPALSSNIQTSRFQVSFGRAKLHQNLTSKLRFQDCSSYIVHVLTSDLFNFCTSSSIPRPLFLLHTSPRHLISSSLRLCDCIARGLLTIHSFGCCCFFSLIGRHHRVLEQLLIPKRGSRQHHTPSIVSTVAPRGQDAWQRVSWCCDGHRLFDVSGSGASQVSLSAMTIAQP
ncbi:hypothetical protein BR93DRAFT_179188 [Coniochaeta sp. PMI_546]|nr:hypothetical protein BR93DRAFT_179188 [Coniochaeta sp. PMI_546]